jgi:hypothetical protein
MRIGCDFSGVVIDTQASKLDVARRFFGVELDGSDSQKLAQGAYLGYEKYKELQHLVFETSELLSAPPIPSAGEGIRWLRQRGCEITIISNIDPRGVRFAQQWLRQNMIEGCEFVSMGVGYSKTVWLRHGFDAYVDDKPSNLAAVAEMTPNRFLFTQPYNVSDVLPEGVVRATGWPELCGQLDGLLQSA